jgi:hypothetical protein
MRNVAQRQSKKSGSKNRKMSGAYQEDEEDPDSRSFASGSDIDAQYLDFLNTANEMANQGDVKLGIRLLEDEINDRLERYSSKDKGVWIYSKGIADLCNNHSSRLISYNQLESALEFL